MPRLRVNAFSLSLDGYGAGPDQSLKDPLGKRGEELHEWVFPTRTFQSMYGKGEGTTGLDEAFAARAMAGLGAWILGRNMFGPVRGPWPDEEWKGWWGEEPPYHVPVFVLTHHPRAPIEMKGGTIFHFVTGGIDEALDRARTAAGDRDIRIGGGVATIRQYLEAGLIDEVHLAFAPILLGRGEPLFAGLDLPAMGFAVTEQVATEKATHVVLTRQAEPEERLMTPERMKAEIPGFYQAWADTDRAAVEAYVGDPFSFTMSRCAVPRTAQPCPGDMAACSSYDDHLDRAEYFRRCWPAAGLQSFDVQQVLPDGGDGALVLYEAKLKNGSTVRNVEYLRFAGDRLSSVEVYFGLGPSETPRKSGCLGSGTKRSAGMTLTLYYHPFAAFCHKVLIALYENDTPFTPVEIDLGDPDHRARLAALWPPTLFPVLEDGANGTVLPESTIIIEYLSAHYPGPFAAIPADPEAALEARLWDRVFNSFVMQPMQTIVFNRIRPADAKDPFGDTKARATLDMAYRMLDERMASRTWAAAEAFSLADCAAAPALFYAEWVHPFRADWPALGAYYDRLEARPSFARVIEEAKPYRHFFPTG